MAKFVFKSASLEDKSAKDEFDYVTHLNTGFIPYITIYPCQMPNSSPKGNFSLVYKFSQ